MFRPSIITFAVSMLVLHVSAPWVGACPFCEAVTQTFCDKVDSMDVIVIARLAEPPEEGSADGGERTTFDVVKILRGEQLLGESRRIKAEYSGDGKTGDTFLLLAKKNLRWFEPTPLTDRAVDFVAASLDLPKVGPERLAFYQQYLEDEDELLARAAYEEFAKTSYAGVVALKDRMDHDQLVDWIKDPNVSVSRRRLYLTMLGICGTEADLPAVEQLVKADRKQVGKAMDATIACYLKLKGPEGMPLIEDLFLKSDEADTYAAIMALRFHGQETDVIPRQRIISAFHLLLDRPKLAELILRDLARWEDWTAIDEAVKLFKEADKKTITVRESVIGYLMECPLPEAEKHLEELEKIDPDAAKRARLFFPPAPSADASEDDETPEEEENVQPTPARDQAFLLLGVLGIPCLVAVFLMALQWFLLRGAGR